MVYVLLTKKPREKLTKKRAERIDKSKLSQLAITTS
jgi:hypothetical protein